MWASLLKFRICLGWMGGSSINFLFLLASPSTHTWITLCHLYGTIGWNHICSRISDLLHYYIHEKFVQSLHNLCTNIREVTLKTQASPIPQTRLFVGIFFGVSCSKTPLDYYCSFWALHKSSKFYTRNYFNLLFVCHHCTLCLINLNFHYDVCYWELKNCFNLIAYHWKRLICSEWNYVVTKCQKGGFSSG